ALEPLGLVLELLHVPAPYSDAVAGKPGDREGEDTANHHIRVAPAGVCPKRWREDEERRSASDERDAPIETSADGEEGDSGRKRVVRVRTDCDRGDDSRYGQDRERILAPEEERQREEKRERDADDRPVLVAERAEGGQESEQHKRQVAQALVPL